MDAPRKARRKSAGATAKKGKSTGSLWQEIRLQMIAEAAYYRAEHRGFAAGEALQDWLEAEKEIDQRLKGGD